MFNYEDFSEMNIGFAALAIYCAPSEKGDAHTNRTYQGIVMNEARGRRIYTFSDGSTLLTEGYDIFFLPKGSTYKVQPLGATEHDSGCYCINFDADIVSAPFKIQPKNPEYFLKIFENAARLWKRMDKTAYNIAIRSVYDIIIGIEKENKRIYMPNKKEAILAPALKKIKSDYTESEISIKELAELAGVSEVYFRRLFFEKFGITPQEYIINMKIRYAKELLYSGGFSVRRVGELCGYPEPCHFSREFARVVGISPTEYVRSKKNFTDQNR